MVLEFRTYDARIETWRRRREAEEFIRRIKARKKAKKSVPYDEVRRCLDLDKVTAIITHNDEYRVTGKVRAYKLNGDTKVL